MLYTLASFCFLIPERDWSKHDWWLWHATNEWSDSIFTDLASGGPLKPDIMLCSIDPSRSCCHTAGAPLIVTEDLIKTFNISLVTRGTIAESQHQDKEKEQERYAYPQTKNIFRWASAKRKYQKSWMQMLRATSLTYAYDCQQLIWPRFELIDLRSISRGQWSRWRNLTVSAIDALNDNLLTTLVKGSPGVDRICTLCSTAPT